MKTIYQILLTAALATGTLCGLSGCSDEDEVSGTQFYSFGPCPVLRGDNIRVIGANLNSVTKVVFPGKAGSKVEVTEFASHTSGLMEVAVPQEAVPGKLKLVVGATDTLTSKSNLSFEEPISVSAVSPTEGLVAGDVVTITGDYLYNIASVTFSENVTVPAEAFVSQERKELKVAVPKAAVSGKITLSDGAEVPTLIESEEVLNIATAAFVSKDKTSVAEGDQIVFTGTHLQLVEQVVYSGEVADKAFTVSADGTRLTSTVPAGLKSGPVSLQLYSGQVLNAGEVEVPTIEVTVVSPSENLRVGDRVTLTGKRLDLVTSILLPGGVSLEKGAWSLNEANTELAFDLPAGVVDGDITVVQNSNISVSGLKISLKKEGNTIWTGNVDFGNWASFLQTEPTDEVCKAIDAPGTLTVNLEQSAASTWWQIRFQYRDWSTCWEKTQENGGIIELAQGATSVSVPVTATDVQHIQAEGFVINGCFVTIKSIEFQKN